tara:strand:- start:4560 stop:5432 length:873 start_codon:yes stop_codon:yes gene_type:complete
MKQWNKVNISHVAMGIMISLSSSFAAPVVRSSCTAGSTKAGCINANETPIQNNIQSLVVASTLIGENEEILNFGRDGFDLTDFGFKEDQTGLASYRSGAAYGAPVLDQHKQCLLDRSENIRSWLSKDPEAVKILHALELSTIYVSARYREDGKEPTYDFESRGFRGAKLYTTGTRHYRDTGNREFFFDVLIDSKKGKCFMPAPHKAFEIQVQRLYKYYKHRMRKKPELLELVKNYKAPQLSYNEDKQYYEGDTQTVSHADPMSSTDHSKTVPLNVPGSQPQGPPRGTRGM